MILQVGGRKGETIVMAMHFQRKPHNACFSGQICTTSWDGKKKHKRKTLEIVEWLSYSWSSLRGLQPSGGVHPLPWLNPWVLPRQPREPWAQCWTPSAVYSWESMIAFQWWSRQKNPPRKQKTDHTPKKHLKVVLTCIIWNMLYPPPRNLTYIQVPKIAIFERRIHFLQGPWFLGYPSWISGMFSASFSTHFFIPVSGASKRNRFQGASTGQRLD